MGEIIAIISGLVEKGYAVRRRKRRRVFPHRPLHGIRQAVPSALDDLEAGARIDVGVS